jgi:hypothetical protein
MNCQIAFTGAQARHRLMDRIADVACGHISEQEEPGGVGMSGKVFIIIFACKNLECSVFYSVIPPGSKEGREIKYRSHDFIIA